MATPWSVVSPSVTRILLAGALTFSPLANENGVGYDSFDFTVNDGLADSLNQATLTIDVTAVDDLPTAADTTVTLTEDTQFVFAVADFGFADVDAMDQLQSITITSLRQSVSSNLMVLALLPIRPSVSPISAPARSLLRRLKMAMASAMTVLISPSMTVSRIR